MTTWVYFLLCEGDVLYTGVAENPAARFDRHRAGQGGRFTQMRKPLKLVGALPFSTRSQALSKEHSIKQLSRQEKWRLAIAASRHGIWLEWLADNSVPPGLVWFS